MIAELISAAVLAADMAVLDAHTFTKAEETRVAVAAAVNWLIDNGLVMPLSDEELRSRFDDGLPVR